jgi:hypothetical protein
MGDTKAIPADASICELEDKRRNLWREMLLIEAELEKCQIQGVLQPEAAERLPEHDKAESLQKILDDTQKAFSEVKSLIAGHRAKLRREAEVKS